MKLIEISDVGGPDVLVVGERATPRIEAHEVLVKVIAAGVNGPDLLQRRGHYPPPKGASDILGLEVSGEIVECGADVRQWALGDKICALTNGGGYADYVAIDARHCLPIPDCVSLIDAAGLIETSFTVWSNVFMKDILKGALYDESERPKGAHFLIHGGAGGIGSTAIQLGAAFGLKVFTTVSSGDKAAFCKALGAHTTINYHMEDFVDMLRDAGGADIILDSIGGDYIARNIKAARHDGRLVQLAFNQGSKVEINLMPVMLKRLTLTGSTLRSRSADTKAAITKSVREHIWPLFQNSKLRATTHKTFPLEEAAAAHTMMEASEHMGKIILTL